MKNAGIEDLSDDQRGSKRVLTWAPPFALALLFMTEATKPLIPEKPSFKYPETPEKYLNMDSEDVESGALAEEFSTRRVYHPVDTEKFMANVARMEQEQRDAESERVASAADQNGVTPPL